MAGGRDGTALESEVWLIPAYLTAYSGLFAAYSVVAAADKRLGSCRCNGIVFHGPRAKDQNPEREREAGLTLAQNADGQASIAIVSVRIGRPAPRSRSGFWSSAACRWTVWPLPRHSQLRLSTLFQSNPVRVYPDERNSVQIKKFLI
jgi:hypothetical protein